MSEFVIYLRLGLEHILDWRGLDHVLFLVTLCAAYQISEWKKILVLVTAFTIGHCITLVLAGMQWLTLPSSLVETLIPVTILITSLYNGIGRKTIDHHHAWWSASMRATYAMALAFGLIHGLGFANYFRTLLGDSGTVVFPLFAFNMGIEFGQLVAVSAFLAVYVLLRRVANLHQHAWRHYVAGLGGGGALWMLLSS
jgi:hypothetical protein